MALSRHRHRRDHKRWPLLTGGGAAIAAIAAAVAVSVTQAAGGTACAAVLSAAGRAQPAAAVSGTATHYVLQGLPNCSYPAPADGLFVALPPDEYASAAACGSYLEVHGPAGTVRAEVIDQCPECTAGHIDLSEAAFAKIAPLNPGLIEVTYQRLVSPSPPAPVQVRVKEGSSRYWLALLGLNTGNPLAAVQVESEGSTRWQPLDRADYNYWIAPSGAGPGPFTVQLTDTVGHVATVHGIALRPGVIQDTGTWMYPAKTSDPAKAPESALPATPVTAPSVRSQAAPPQTAPPQASQPQASQPQARPHPAATRPAAGSSPGTRHTPSPSC